MVLFDDSGELDVSRKLEADRVVVVLVDLDRHVVGEQLAVVADRLGAQREGLEGGLIHEVKAVAVGVLKRSRHVDQAHLASGQ